jgi:hypothetical protein
MAEPEKETVASEPAAREFVLCYTTYVKGEAFMRECARLGCRVQRRSLLK